MPKVQEIQVYDAEGRVVQTIKAGEIFSGMSKEEGKAILKLVLKEGQLVVQCEK